MLLPVAALAVAKIAWSGAIAWLVLLPFLWALAPSRAVALSVVITYYLVGTHEIPSIYRQFFPEAGAWGGIAAWFLLVGVNVLPWWVVWARTPVRAALGMVLIVVLLAIPPIGLFSVMHPLFAAGELFTNAGWGGAVAMTACLAVAAAAGTDVRSGQIKRVMLAALCLPLAWGMLISSSGEPPSIVARSMAGWLVLDTRLGRLGSERGDEYERHMRLNEIALRALAGVNPPAVILFPEEVAGIWRPAAAWWWRPVAERAKASETTILIGSDVRSGRGFSNALISISGPDAIHDVAHARIPMPIGLWQPWRDDAWSARPWDDGVIQVTGRTLSISICWEDYLVWPKAVDFAVAKPDMVVSVANRWFGSAPVSEEIQRRSVEAWAKLFDVPLVRAVNK